MRAKTTVKETILSTVSDNVQEHGVVEAIEDVSLSSTNAAIQNHSPFPYFDEYREWF